MTAAESFTAPVPGGYVVLQPVALGAARLAVTEVYLPASEVSSGVGASWAVMTAVAVALIGVSVLVADRLATRITGPARALADAAAALGNGDLTARSEPAGRPAAGGGARLQCDGRAADEADHGRTGDGGGPSAPAADAADGAGMNAAGLGPGHAADETRLAVSRLEQEIDLIIRAARRLRRKSRAARRR